MSRSLKLIATCSVFAFTIAIANGSHAFAGQAGPQNSEANAEGSHHVAEAPSAGTPAQVWHEIAAKRSTLEKLVWETELDKIHAAAEGLPALGAKLLSVSTELEGGKRVRVEAAVKQLPKATNRLHEAADGGDALKTGAEFKKLDGLLELIAAQYPHGVLTVSEESPSHHANMEPAAKPSEHADHGGGKPSSIPENAQKVSVAANDFRFEPAEIVVKRGIPVALTLINQGQNEHAWVIESKPAVHLHAMIKGTDTRVFTLEEPGEYPIKCTIPGHTELGMVGKVVVR